MGGKKKYIEMFGSFTEPWAFSCHLSVSALVCEVCLHGSAPWVCISDICSYFQMPGAFFSLLKFK